MPTHWTYDAFSPGEDLLQGDILTRTSALEALLAEVHSYFLDPKFTAFAVITQSCDLVRRGPSCKADYINLAVIRELEPILPDIVGEVAGTGLPGVYRTSSRVFAIELLKKIINQNELSRGLFYLHPDGDVGIATPSVAMLRISIAVRQEHFELLRAARRGRLSVEFRNKLGWLCGNLFSRVDTPDWSDKEAVATELTQVETLLRSIDGDERQYWIPDGWVDSAVKAGVLLDGKSKEEAVALLRKHAPAEPLQIALDRVRYIALQLLAVEQAMGLRDSLKADHVFRHAVASELAARLQTLVSLGGAAVQPQIMNNAVIVESVMQNVFLNVRRFLETSRHAPVAVLEETLRAVTIPTPTAQGLRQIVQANVDTSWPSVEPGLAVLTGEPLYSDTAISQIASCVKPLQDTPMLSTITKLTSRLSNDQEYTNLFRGTSIAFPAGLD